MPTETTTFFFGSTFLVGVHLIITYDAAISLGRKEACRTPTAYEWGCFPVQIQQGDFREPWQNVQPTGERNRWRKHRKSCKFLLTFLDAVSLELIFKSTNASLGTNCMLWLIPRSALCLFSLILSQAHPLTFSILQWNNKWHTRMSWGSSFALLQALWLVKGQCWECLRNAGECIHFFSLGLQVYYLCISVHGRSGLVQHGWVCLMCLCLS
jgi:hypothetical protein